MFSTSALNLHLQASTPSDQLCSTSMLPTPPQFLYQAPPGAQQLTLPDFPKVPHFGQLIALALVEVMAGAPTDVVTRVCDTISSRSGFGRRVTYLCVTPVEAESDVHTFLDVDPYENANMSVLLACEWTQAAPQSRWLNKSASKNM